MKCPTCTTAVLGDVQVLQGIEIDDCPTCRGVWASTAASSTRSSSARRPRTPPSLPPRRRRRPFPSRPQPAPVLLATTDKRHHDDHDDHHGYGKHGKRSFLKDLFD